MLLHQFPGGNQCKTKNMENPVNGDNAEKKPGIESILSNLKPAIENLIKDAPDWGTVNLNIIFNAGIIKRLEV
jgi:hypothetical protein